MRFAHGIMVLAIALAAPVLAQEAKAKKTPAKKPPPRVTDPTNATLQPTRVVEYKVVGDLHLSLNIFQPEITARDAGKPLPCFVAIHGGGWTGGEPRVMFTQVKQMTDLGMIGVSVQYRLTGGRKTATVFDCVKDGKSAVRYIRKHAAELGIDPDRIAVCGGSAGGHVAVGTAIFPEINEAGEDAAVSSVPNALILYYPVIDTSTEGYGNAKCGERWKELSPVHNVKPGLPPTIIFHGTGDLTTPYQGAAEFHKLMKQHGNVCELVTHEGGVHGYFLYEQPLYDQTVRRTIEFLHQSKILK